jgi:hypothetical protein
MVIADSHYGGIKALKYFQDQDIQTCIPLESMIIPRADSETPIPR